MIKIIALLILILGLGAGVYLVQHPTFFKPKAYETDTDKIARERVYQFEKGFQIDTSEAYKIPSGDIYDVLNTQWVRLVYRVAQGIPDNIPPNVKILVIFNAESVPGYPAVKHEPKGSQNVDEWKSYIDQYYIPALKDFLSKNPRFDAIQIWNEEDNCPPGDFLSCTRLPTEVYSYMLMKVATEIRGSTENKRIITGGLVTGNTDYVVDLKKVHPGILKLIDGIAIHPYGVSPAGWCNTNPATEACGADKNGKGGIVLPFGDLATVIQSYEKVSDGLPIWITEIGIHGDNELLQGEFLRRVFEVLSRVKIPVAIWYPWSDALLAGPEENSSFGLVNKNNVIKAAGIEFKLFNSQ